MTQQNKSIEDVIKEFKETGWFATIEDARNHKLAPACLKDITVALTSLAQQSKEEERERIRQMVIQMIHNGEDITEVERRLNSLSNTS